MLATLEWSVEPAGVVTLGASGQHVTVTPAGAGTATIKASVIPIEGYEFDKDSELVSECRVTVLDEFALSESKLLFFSGEAAAQSVETALTSAELAALTQVADIVWSKTGNGAQIPAESAGVSVAVSAGSVDSAQIEAQLVVKEGSEGSFNGDGVWAAPVEVKTFAAPVPVITGTAGNKMLGAGNTAANFDLSMSYPQALDEFGPEAVWASSAVNTAAVAGGALANGSSAARLTAKAQGSASISAVLKVGGRSFPAAAAPVTVVVYTPPTWDVENIAISGAVSKGGKLTLTDTTASALITAVAQRTSDANPPTNTNIIWTVSDTSKVSVVAESAGNETGGKVTIKALDKTASDVTVTAKSQSNQNVVGTFKVQVNPITVTITGGQAALVYGGNMTLNATASLGDIKWSVSSGSDKAQIDKTEGASTKATAKGLITGDAVIKIKAAAKLKESYFAEHTFTLKPHTFNIAFNANGGAGSMTAQSGVAYGSATAIAASAFTQDGFTFSGWAESAAGVVTAVDKAAVSVLNNNAEAKKPNGNVTLYAKWMIVGSKIPQADIVERVYNDATAKWEMVYVIRVSRQITITEGFNGRILLAGGGGGGGGGDCQPNWRDGKNGNGGDVTVDTSYTFTAGTYNAVVGGGGAGGKSDSGGGAAFVFGRVGGKGGATELKNASGAVLFTAAGGLGGRGSHDNGGNGGTVVDGANTGVYKDIAPDEKAYGQKGVFMQVGAENTGSGGGGGKGYEAYNRRSPAGKAGGSGVIIIREIL